MVDGAGEIGRVQVPLGSGKARLMSSVRRCMAIYGGV